MSDTRPRTRRPAPPAPMPSLLEDYPLPRWSVGIAVLLGSALILAVLAT